MTRYDSIIVYKDTLIPYGMATEEECERDNLTYIMVREDDLIEYFCKYLEDDLDCDFETWLLEESTADDTIDLARFLFDRI